MARNTVQARKKKVVKVAETPPPAAEPVGEPEPEHEEEEEQPEDAVMESSEVVDELGEEEAMEDEGGDREEEAAADEVEAEEDEEEQQEVEEEEHNEGEEDGEGAENGEGKKRKKVSPKQPAAKKQKVEKPVRMKVYMRSTPDDLFEDMLETHLKENDINVKEIKRTTEAEWCLFGELVLEGPQDKVKIESISGLVDSKEIKMEEIEEPTRTDSDKLDAADEHILFVRNLVKVCTEDNLKTLFPDCIDFRLPTRNGRNRGFAFVQFKSKEVLQEVIKNKQGVELLGKKLRLGPYSSKKPVPDQKDDGQKTPVKGQEKARDSNVDTSQNRVLFVGNLCYETDEAKIMRVFRTAVNVKILRFSNTGKSKGVAFIEFKSPMGAKKAIEKFKTATIDGRKVNIEYADSEKFKSGEGVRPSNPDITRKPMGGRSLLGGGGGGGFGPGMSGGFQDRNPGIRSLLDNYGRPVDLEGEYSRRMGNMMGGMDGNMGVGMGGGLGGGMGSRMGMGLDAGLGGMASNSLGLGGRMGLDSGLVNRMGLEAGLSGRMGLDSGLGGRMDTGFGNRLGLDSGLGGQMDLDSGLGGRMGLDSGLGSRMSLDSGIGNRMGLDSGFRAGRLSLESGMGLDSGFGGRLGLDSGLAGFGGRTGGMDTGRNTLGLGRTSMGGMGGGRSNMGGGRSNMGSGRTNMGGGRTNIGGGRNNLGGFGNRGVNNRNRQGNQKAW